MKIRVWDAESLRTKAILASRNSVYRLAWSDDETVLASTNYDERRSIRLWHAPKLDVDELPNSDESQ